MKNENENENENENKNEEFVILHKDVRDIVKDLQRKEEQRKEDSAQEEKGDTIDQILFGKN